MTACMQRHMYAKMQTQNTHALSSVDALATPAMITLYMAMVLFVRRARAACAAALEVPAFSEVSKSTSSIVIMVWTSFGNDLHADNIPSRQLSWRCLRAIDAQAAVMCSHDDRSQLHGLRTCAHMTFDARVARARGSCNVQAILLAEDCEDVERAAASSKVGVVVAEFDHVGNVRRDPIAEDLAESLDGLNLVGVEFPHTWQQTIR